MTKWYCFGIASLLLCLALAFAPEAARAVPGGAGTAATLSTTSLPAATAAAKNGVAGAGVADKKNLFVGVGGMGDLPGFPAVGTGVFSGVTVPLGGVGGGVGGFGQLGGFGGGGFGGGGTPLGGFGGGGGELGGGAGGIGGGGADGITPLVVVD